MSEVSTLPTLYRRRARLAFDSMLAFDGVDQYGDCGVNANIQNVVDKDKDFTTSIFGKINVITTNNYYACFDDVFGSNNRGWVLYANQSGSDYILRFILYGGINANRHAFSSISAINPETINHIAITYLANAGGAQFYVNGRPVPTTLNTSGTMGNVYDLSPELWISGRKGFNSYKAMSINHFTVFNRILTETEIKSIHRLGGVLPESTHEACVAHYVAIPGADKMWDVVKIYNDSKTVPISTDYPGTYVNFTNAELGLTAPEDNTAHIDLYTKDYYEWNNSPEFSGDTITAFNEQIKLKDGVTNPDNVSIELGNLPSGLSLSATGALTGTATETGEFNLLLKLTDGNGKNFYIQVQIIIS